MISAEKQTYIAAGDPDQLTAYIQNCQICNFRGEAASQLRNMGRQRLYSQLTAAGTDQQAMKQFLTECGDACPEDLREEAQARLRQASAPNSTPATAVPSVENAKFEAASRADQIEQKQKQAREQQAEQQQNAVANTTPPAAIQASPDPSLDAWNATKSTEIVAALEAFVSRYPTSFYADLARARIDDLKLKQETAERQAIVRSMQQALKGIDCYEGPIDGVWSRSSQEALDRFNRLAKRAPATSGPVQETLDSLNGWRGEHCSTKAATEPVAKKSPAAREHVPTTVEKKTAPAAREHVPTRVEKNPPQRQRSASQPSPASNTGSDFRVYCQNGPSGCPWLDSRGRP